MAKRDPLAHLSTEALEAALQERKGAEQAAAQAKRERKEGQKVVVVGGRKLTLRVSEKGALSVYGLGQWPATLYKEKWLALMSIATDIVDFIGEHEDELSAKPAKKGEDKGEQGS